jgi:hypothetical protein
MFIRRAAVKYSYRAAAQSLFKFRNKLNKNGDFMLMTREEILSKSVLKSAIVSVPEFGGDIRVTEMSGAMRDAWEQSLQERDASKRMVSPRAKLVVATAVDDNGNALFTDKDVDRVSKLSSKALDRICNAAQRLNKLMAEDLESSEKN